MLPRVALLLVLSASILSAQFSGLAPTADGSAVYFASTLRLKDLSQPLNGKIYLANGSGVRVFRVQEPAGAPAEAPPCTAGGFSDYVAAEVSSNGAMALLYVAAEQYGGCSFPPNLWMTRLVTLSRELTVHGIAHLSADGQHAIVLRAATARAGAAVGFAYVDPASGEETPVSLNSEQFNAPVFPEYIQQPIGGGRIIANDGTALVAIRSYSDFTAGRGYLLRPNAASVPFPVVGGLPLIIDSSGSKVVYHKQGLNLLDLRTLESTPLIVDDSGVTGLELTDDARHLLFLRGGQVHVLETVSGVDRALTSDAASIVEAAISSDGKVVFAVTGVGRLLKIGADDGAQFELVGRTPYFKPVTLPLQPGFTGTLSGGGLSNSVLNGAVPLDASLGGVTVSIGGRKAPLTQLTPGSVSFIVPWDVAATGGRVHVVADAAGENTPFYFPEADALVMPGDEPRAGAIFRQDWSQTYVGPIQTGEVIHVYAINLGPAIPEVPPGGSAPIGEPFSRLAPPLTCDNAEVLYAGLAPGAVERVYQVDLRIGPTPGYQKFGCSLGGRLLGLTLYIVK